MQTSSNTVLHGAWRNPVRVQIGNGMPESVTDAKNALEALSFRWPTERGEHFRRARQHCAAALQGHVSAEVARESFIAASIEARMLVH